MKCYSNAIKLDKNDENAIYNSGLILKKLEKYEKALKCFENTLILKPNKVDAWYNKGLMLEKLGKSKEAVECLDKVLELDRFEEVKKEKTRILSSKSHWRKNCSWI